MTGELLNCGFILYSLTAGIGQRCSVDPEGRTVNKDGNLTRVREGMEGLGSSNI